ncbi:hypothetical protein [Soonwooa sp.]|uniref:hypothetical protein n=1 Tax=Soonwooa sp. TaxID=1938592 RepID=UPI002625DB7C|nr:hypothetical protein [Soonwooa sp.]
MNKFSMFSKYGGADTSPLVRPFEKKIVKILEELNDNAYSINGIQFHIELRVDGDLFRYGDPSGCSHLKYFKKKNLIAITIGVGYDLFDKKENIDIFLRENLTIAITQMITRIEKENIEN